MQRIRSLHVLSLLLITSCAMQQARPAELDDLAGTWQFAGEVPVGAKIPTLAIQRDGRVGGTSGVNRYQTTLTTENATKGSFGVGPVAGTRMMGTRDAMQLETSFLEALALADLALVAGDLLVLKNGERTLLRFRRVTRG